MLGIQDRAPKWLLISVHLFCRCLQCRPSQEIRHPHFTQVGIIRFSTVHRGAVQRIQPPLLQRKKIEGFLPPWVGNSGSCPRSHSLFGAKLVLVELVLEHQPFEFLCLFASPPSHRIGLMCQGGGSAEGQIGRHHLPIPPHSHPVWPPSGSS